MQTKLISILNDRNMKYGDIAKILNISEKQTGLKIRGKAPFKSTEMFKLSEYFGLPLDDIFLNNMYQNGTLKQKEKEE